MQLCFSVSAEFCRTLRPTPRRVTGKAIKEKWGLIITAAYAVIVLAFLTPATVLLTESRRPKLEDFRHAYAVWGTWIVLGIILLGEMVLLWLSVDTTRRQLRPRRRVIVTAAVAGFFLMFLSLATGIAFVLAVWGEGSIPDLPNILVFVAAVAVPWLIWGFLFYRFYRDSTDLVTRAVTWLLRGSVVELLVAVPAHVITRRRDDCCAPAITGFSITTGIAIMLLSFGPSVFLLFKKKMGLAEPKHTVTA